MPDDVAHWLFICARNGAWTWRSPNAAASGPLRTLDEARADAMRFGFDPFVHQWTTMMDGRTTRFRG
jgi:hypothetical protein